MNIAEELHQKRISIGKTIQSKRMEKGLRQIDLANRLGVGTSTISRWEQGNVRGMKAHLVKNLCDVLGIKVTAFIEAPINEDNEALVVVQNGLMQFMFKDEPEMLTVTNNVTLDGELGGVKLDRELLKTAKRLIKLAIEDVESQVEPSRWHELNMLPPQRRIKAKKDPDQ